MKQAPIAATLLAFGVAVSPAAMSAAPRDPLPPVIHQQEDENEPVDPEQLRAGNLQEIQAWLRRLVGSYRVYTYVSFNGDLKDEPVFSGSPLSSGRTINVRELVDKAGKDYSSWMDCVGIGSGPGVHCIWGSVLKEPAEKAEWSDQQDFDRVEDLLQFGINPNASEIQMFKIHTSLVVQSSAAGRGATFPGSLVQASAALQGDTLHLKWVCPGSSPCQMAYRITVPVDREYVLLDSIFITSGGTRSRQYYLYPVAAEERASADDPAHISLYDKLRERMKRPPGPR